MNSDLQEQEDELLALQSIFDSEEFVRHQWTSAGTIRVCVELPEDFSVVLREGESRRQYDISFLPPLLLTFELLKDYPSTSPPSFTLTCSWLTHSQLAALSTQLVELYHATGGAVVLFSWVQFLKEDALVSLGIHSELEIPPDGGSTLQDAAASDVKDNRLPLDSKTEDDRRDDEGVDISSPAVLSSKSSDQPSPTTDLAGSLLVDSEASSQDENHGVSGPSLTPSQILLSKILINDASERQRAFDKTVFDCGVCFLSNLGSKCERLHECGHVFCQTCLGEFCKVQITEGNVRGVTCPQADCPATPTPAQVLTLVGQELFSRYDRLLLQASLDSMPDVMYCPRPTCALAIIVDKSSTAQMCSVCNFAFCIKCKKTYHGTDECEDKKPQVVEQDDALGFLPLPRSEEGLTAIWKDYTTGSKERKRLLERRHGLQIMRLLESRLCLKWISINSKPCPHCFTNIEKNGGCNAMFCTQCKRLFSWL